MMMRDEILKAALELFRRKGYLGTSMVNIAQAVGLTKGGIYHYISSKEDLLAEIHDQMVNAFLERINLFVEAEPDPKRKLVNWIKAHALIMRDYQAAIKVFFTEMENLDEATFKRILVKRDVVTNKLRDIIIAGVASGQFRADLDPKITCFLIFGMLNWFYQWYRPNGPYSMEMIAENVVKLVCDGVLARPGKEGETTDGHSE